jgi:hypothetical protein
VAEYCFDDWSLVLADAPCSEQLGIGDSDLSGKLIRNVCSFVTVFSDLVLRHMGCNKDAHNHLTMVF